MLGIINSSMKIILSRTCEIHPGITQLDQELYNDHPELVELACKFEYEAVKETHKSPQTLLQQNPRLPKEQ